MIVTEPLEVSLSIAAHFAMSFCRSSFDKVFGPNFFLLIFEVPVFVFPNADDFGGRNLFENRVREAVSGFLNGLEFSNPFARFPFFHVGVVKLVPRSVSVHSCTIS